VVVGVQYDYGIGCFEYTAISSAFREIAEGASVPFYWLKCHKTNAGMISVEAIEQKGA
jgi:hypothetical protein